MRFSHHKQAFSSLQQPGMGAMAGVPSLGGTALAGPQYSGHFPWTGRFPANPSVAAQAQPPSVSSADASGIQEAMAKRGEECGSVARSASGEGARKFKLDEEGDTTGEKAWKTLDGYMKKAGLNSFQGQFFGRLLQAGLAPEDFSQVVKQASERFGPEAGQELEAGLEKLAFIGPALRAASSGIKSLGQKALGGAAPAAVRGAAKQVGTTGARQSLSRAAGAAGGAALRGAKNMATAPHLKSQVTTGATSGAFNPYTGAASSSAWDDDGSLDWSQIAGSAATGAGLGRAGGAYSRRLGQWMAGRQRQALAGEAVGGSGGAVANILGYNVDPQAASRVGFSLGGLAPQRLANVPGLAQATKAAPRVLGPRMGRAVQKAMVAPLTTRTGKGVLDKADPVQWLMRGGRAVAQRAKANPWGAARDVGLGAGGLGLGAAALQVPETLRQQGQQIQEQVAGQGQQIQEQVAGVRQDAGRQLQQLQDKVPDVNSLGGVGDWLGGLLGGGQGGQDGQGGFDLGQYVSQNRNWLLPLLLAGGGAATGGLLGDRGGAMLGGLGLPLLYMLASGQLSGGGQAQAAPPPSDTAPQSSDQDSGAIDAGGRPDPARAVSRRMPNEIRRQQQLQNPLAPYTMPQFQKTY